MSMARSTGPSSSGSDRGASGGRYRFESVAGTDTGSVRTHNEDAYLDRPDIGLWVVADGMGGHAAGEVASGAIVAALDDLAPPDSAPAFLREVRSRLLRVNRELRELAEDRGGPVASTVVALLAFGHHFAYAWAGDSRLYLMRGGRLKQLTRDHSYVQELVDRGEITPEEARFHAQGNVVTRGLGAEDELELDMAEARLEADDLFLLCSDGLNRTVSDVEIARVLAETPLKQVVETLLGLALRRGAPDNVTVIVVHYSRN